MAGGDKPREMRKLYIHTPLIESYALSKCLGGKVYLKMDNAQPSDSFKLRGMSNHIQKELQRGCERLVCSSGGNAGLSAAYVAKKLAIPIKIFVPSSTPVFMRERIQGEEAEVVVHGSVWDEANALAVKEAEKPGVSLIHPFDHPDLWEGHASMIEEIAADLEGITPDLVVTVVGGGGLLCGIVEGMRNVGWDHIPILTMETNGANCFNASVKAGKLVTLTDITSLAKTLGALTATKQVMKYHEERKILSEVVSDKQAIQACTQFLDDARVLVEPSCGAGLAAFYSGIIQRLQEEGKLATVKTAVAIVCGGHGTTLKALKNWQKQVGMDT